MDGILGQTNDRQIKGLNSDLDAVLWAVHLFFFYYNFHYLFPFTTMTLQASNSYFGGNFQTFDIKASLHNYYSIFGMKFPKIPWWLQPMSEGALTPFYRFWELLFTYMAS